MTQRTVVCQAPLLMGFFRQEYWSGLPFPPPGDLPNPRIKPTSAFPELAGGFFTTDRCGNPFMINKQSQKDKYLYKVSTVVTFIETESRIGGFQELGKRGNEECLMVMKMQCGKMKKFLKLVTQQCEYTEHY